ncbi:MAG: hypothetical protein ACOH18_05190 [Candidatus Saccharimonadaceae bacterium]
MLITGELYTRKVAAQVGSMLKYLFEHPEDTRFFEVELDYYEKGRSVRTETVLVRLVEKDDARIVELANGREIVRCITKDNVRIDFMFGHEDERELEPAFVFYDKP